MKWISVKVRLPDVEEQVLLGHWYEHDAVWLWIASGSYEDGNWFCDWEDGAFKSKFFHTVTHWAPLPGPPEVDK